MTAHPADPADVEHRRTHGTVTPGESVRALLLALGTAAVYVALAWARGVLGVARNDDWSFYRTAFRWADAGVLELTGWAQMMLVGQVVLAWPVVTVFGAEFAPLQVMVAVLAAVGLWAAYLVVRGVLPRGWSAVCVACLALGPVYPSLGVSFMTDAPAFSLQMLCLLAGQRALRARVPSTVWFAVSLGLGVAAFSIREYGIAAGFAVAVVVLARAFMLDRRLAGRLLAIAVTALAVVAALFVWRSGLAHSTPTEFLVSVSSLRTDLEIAVRATLFLGLFVMPAVVVVSPVRLMRALIATASPVVAGLAGVAVGGVAVATAFVVGNDSGWVSSYLSKAGPYTKSLGGPPVVVLPDRLWRLMFVAAGAAVIVVVVLAAVAFGSRCRPAHPADVAIGGGGRLAFVWDPAALVQVFVVSSAAVSIVVVMTTTAPFFDRYLIAMAPFVAALVIRTARHQQVVMARATWSAGVALAALTLVGVVMADAAASFDAGKWRLASTVENMGYEAATIDGGFEWFSFHQPEPGARRSGLPDRNFWVRFFGGPMVCVTTFRGTPPVPPLPGAEVDPVVIASVTVSSVLVADYQLTAVAGPQRCDPS